MKSLIYMLDTNICIYLINKKPKAVPARFAELTATDVGISSITAAELSFGVAKSASQKNALALQQFLSTLQLWPFDENAAAAYGPLRAHLAQAGTPIGPMDTLIAAHALSLGARIISNNLREFERVPGLQTENWV